MAPTGPLHQSSVGTTPYRSRGGPRCLSLARSPTAHIRVEQNTPECRATGFCIPWLRRASQAKMCPAIGTRLSRGACCCYYYYSCYYYYYYYCYYCYYYYYYFIPIAAGCSAWRLRLVAVHCTGASRALNHMDKVEFRYE